MTKLGTRYGSAMVAGLLLASCAAVPPHTAQNPAEQPAAMPAETIAIAVGPCFGFCPVYDLRIAPDGSVTFEGQRHTAVLGERRRAAGPESYKSLAADLAPYRPQTGSTATIDCQTAISDTSTYTITWTDPHGVKTIAQRRRGCSGGPGQALDSLLDGVPGRLGVAEWARQITRPGSSRG